MTKLKKTISVATTFDVYQLDEFLGEGGAGRVYGGAGTDQVPVAVKVLANDRASADKRRRFKNEIGFLLQNRHRNIVTVIDHGLVNEKDMVGPFYVMRRYHSNLRNLIQAGIDAGLILGLFSQILDGVEAAHLQRVVHRDLKPENILWDKSVLAIADFGTARFTEDLALTAVETGPGQRLANFQYAAPEQRVPGKDVGFLADIYALGLMLNEMFTGEVPHGTDPTPISSVSRDHAFLDPIVTAMLNQAPEKRPASISDVKILIQRHQSEAVSLQKISKVDGAVIATKEIDEPLALVPPRLVDFDWDHGTLTLILDREATPEWVRALTKMDSYMSVLGKEPARFSFSGNMAQVTAAEHEVQSVINNFKMWLPLASQKLKSLLEQDAQKKDEQQREALRLAKKDEEQRLRVLRNVHI
jgi:serine/threonine protein kinase